MLVSIVMGTLDVRTEGGKATTTTALCVHSPDRSMWLKAPSVDCCVEQMNWTGRCQLIMVYLFDVSLQLVSYAPKRDVE